MAEDKTGFEGTKPWPTTSVHGNPVLEGTPLESPPRQAQALDNPTTPPLEVKFDKSALASSLPPEQPKTQIPAMDGSGAVMEVGRGQPFVPESAVNQVVPADSSTENLPPEKVGFLKGVANKLKEMAGMG